MLHAFVRPPNRVDLAVCARCLYVAAVTVSVQGEWVTVINVRDVVCAVPRPRSNVPGDQGDTTTNRMEPQ